VKSDIEDFAVTTETLDRLWHLAEREAQNSVEGPEHIFDPIGLILRRTPKNFGYWATPVNSVSFATTGGNGVHYGLLTADGGISDDSPVVMTVPMMFDKPNIIVGRSLLEFLCLGCSTGYFVLEQLAYDKVDTMELIQHPRRLFEDSYGKGFSTHKSFQREKHLLEALIKDFDLRPWDRLEEQLDELQERYLPLLKLSARQS
jgi:hypothetical protein